MPSDGLRERFSRLPNEELARITRSSDHTEEARAVAAQLLSERGVNPEAVPAPAPPPEDPRTSRRLRRWIVAAVIAAAISVIARQAPGCEADLREGYLRDDVERARRVLEQASYRELGSVVQRAHLRELIRACELELDAEKQTAPSCEEMKAAAEALSPSPSGSGPR